MSFIGPITESFIKTLMCELDKKENKEKIINALIGDIIIKSYKYCTMLTIILFIIIILLIIIMMIIIKKE